MLAQTLAKILDVPFAIADATSLTEAGYVGEDVKMSCSSSYRRQTTISNARRALSISTRSTRSPQIGQSVDHAMYRRRRAAGALQKIIEGTTANVPPQGGRKHPQQEYLQVDTTNILFIVGGALKA